MNTMYFHFLPLFSKKIYGIYEQLISKAENLDQQKPGGRGKGGGKKVL